MALIVGLAGFAQWRRTKRSGKFLVDREAAYLAVWAAVEQIHLYVPSDKFTSRGVDERVRQVNAALIKHGLHIRERDSNLTSEYMEALRACAAMLAQYSPAHRIRKDMSNTVISPKLPLEFEPSWRRLEQARNALVRAFRRVIG